MNNKRLLAIAFVMAVSTSAYAGNANLSSPPCQEKEPFCTYAPPKLSGDDMAAAVRKLITSAKDPIYRVPFDSKEHDPVKMHTPDPVMKDFIANKNFKFLTPDTVIEKSSDPRLQDMLGEECLKKLIEKGPSLKSDGQDSGPFYFYDIKTQLNSKTTYKAVIVYGIEANVYKDEKIGQFVIFKPKTKCDYLYTMPMYGVDFRKRETQSPSTISGYAPIFSGLGYYKNELFYYKAEGNYYGHIESDLSYGLVWYRGVLKNSKGSLLFKETGSVGMSPLPKSFDPFSLLNKENLR